MKWFRKWLFNSLERAKKERAGVSLADIASVTQSLSPRTGKAGHKRVELLKAANGKILEIAHRKTPQHDWEVTLYIVRDDEALADAVAAALLITGEN